MTVNTVQESESMLPASPASKPKQTVSSQDLIDIQVQQQQSSGRKNYSHLTVDTSVCEEPDSGAIKPQLVDTQTSPMHKEDNLGRAPGAFEIKMHQVFNDEEDQEVRQSMETSSKVDTSMDGSGLNKTVDTAVAICKSSAPMPILPKPKILFKEPPKCPLNHIRFIELRKFFEYENVKPDGMSIGFDLVGNRRKMIQLKTEDRVANKGSLPAKKEDEILAKMDDSTRFIHNAVYARDTSIIDPETGMIPQRAAFSHQNELDVKRLVKEREISYNQEHSGLSPRSPARRQRPQQQLPDSQLYKVTGPEDKTLIFESRFESGNLYLAQKVSESEYNLLMQNDINTSGHTQWFYFRVCNTRAKQTVKFNILNYSKPDSLFNYGMKVTVYSEKKAAKSNVGWHKDGENISYKHNGIRKDINYASRCFYTATWTYTFEHDFDTVFFAYSYPYTYSDLNADIENIETDEVRSQYVTKRSLCTTLAGVSCDILTITSRENLEDFAKRKGVIITGRVHPGETVGSHMMKGVLLFLTDPNNPEAKLLRENFVFKVIPMLNPDGVINGNYRCSLAGCDLNRRWKTPSKMLHPTIYHTKKLVQQVHEERGLLMFCDLHGHSRKQNVFMYGCNYKQSPGECRVFPFILSKLNPFFQFESSKFGVQKSKESTARVALFKELKNVPNVYTMESSFAGVDFGKMAGKHLSVEMLMSLGSDLCRTILAYSNIFVQPELENLPFFKNKRNLGKKNYKEDDMIKKAIMQEFNDNKDLLAAGDGDSSSGSDSAPSEDNLPAEQIVKNLPIVDKTLKVQLKKEQQKKAQEKIEANQPHYGRQTSIPKKPEPQLKRVDSPRKPLIKLVLAAPQTKPEEKKAEDEKPKKPKVETRDACTQTDRSDMKHIKDKEMKKKQREAEKEQMRLATQRKQQAASIEKSGGRLQKMEMPLPRGDRIVHQEGPRGSVAPNKSIPHQQQSISRQKREKMPAPPDSANNKNSKTINLNQQWSNPNLKPVVMAPKNQGEKPVAPIMVPNRTNIEMMAKDQQMFRLASINGSNKYAFIGVESKFPNTTIQQKPPSHESKAKHQHGKNPTNQEKKQRDSQLNSFSHHEKQANQQLQDLHFKVKNEPGAMASVNNLEQFLNQQGSANRVVKDKMGGYLKQHGADHKRGDEAHLQINVPSSSNPMQQYYSQTMSRNQVKPQLFEGLAQTPSHVQNQQKVAQLQVMQTNAHEEADRASKRGSVFNTERKQDQPGGEIDLVVSPPRKMQGQTVGDHAAMFPQHQAKEQVAAQKFSIPVQGVNNKFSAHYNYAGQNISQALRSGNFPSNVPAGNKNNSQGNLAVSNRNFAKKAPSGAFEPNVISPTQSLMTKSQIRQSLTNQLEYQTMRSTGQNSTQQSSQVVSKESTKFPFLNNATPKPAGASSSRTPVSASQFSIQSPTNNMNVQQSMRHHQNFHQQKQVQKMPQIDGASTPNIKRASGDLVTSGYHQILSPTQQPRGKFPQHANTVEQSLVVSTTLVNNPLPKDLIIKEDLDENAMSPINLKRGEQHRLRQKKSGTDMSNNYQKPPHGGQSGRNSQQNSNVQGNQRLDSDQQVVPGTSTQKVYSVGKRYSRNS